MDDLRTKRYRDKINLIINYLKDLPLEPSNELEKRGIFYSLQTSIEAMVDLIAMIIKDMGKEVKDDNSNISVVIAEKKLDPELGVQLRKANGMRNIIVHRYNKFDEKIILDSIKQVKILLFQWLDIVEEILSELT